MTSASHIRREPYRRSAAALAAALLVLAGCAASPGAVGPRPGMADGERLAPGLWSVRATGRTPERARDAALYRGAVLAKAAGFSHVRIIAHRLEAFDYSNAPIATKFGELSQPSGAPERTVFLELAGVADGAAAPSCDASAQAASLCRTTGVDETLAALGPELGRTPQETAAEVEAARRALAGRRGE